MLVPLAMALLTGFVVLVPIAMALVVVRDATPRGSDPDGGLGTLTGAEPEPVKVTAAGG